MGKPKNKSGSLTSQKKVHKYGSLTKEKGNKILVKYKSVYTVKEVMNDFRIKRSTSKDIEKSPDKIETFSQTQLCFEAGSSSITSTLEGVTDAVPKGVDEAVFKCDRQPVDRISSSPSNTDGPPAGPSAVSQALPDHLHQSWPSPGQSGLVSVSPILPTDSEGQSAGLLITANTKEEVDVDCLTDMYSSTEPHINALEGFGEPDTYGNTQSVLKNTSINGQSSSFAEQQIDALSEKEEMDDCRDFSRVVANDLKKMNANQRAIAQKVINDALFLGKLGMLTKSSTVISYNS